MVVVGCVGEDPSRLEGRDGVSRQTLGGAPEKEKNETKTI
jgi:hypothetical protein